MRQFFDNRLLKILYNYHRVISSNNLIDQMNINKMNLLKNTKYKMFNF